MAKYNLYTLLHRNYPWEITLPNGICSEWFNYT